MAEPLSIAATCLSLLSMVGKSVTSIDSLLRAAPHVQQPDITSLSQELESLQRVIRTLARDAARPGRYSPPDTREIVLVLRDCGTTMTKLQQALDKYPYVDKMTNTRWTLGLDEKNEIAQLRLTLQNQKSTLSLALELVAISMIRTVQPDTAESRRKASSTNRDETQIRQDTAEMIENLRKIHGQHWDGGVAMQRYVDELTTYAESAYAESVVDYDDQTQSVRSWDGVDDVASATLSDPSSKTTISTDQRQGPPTPPDIMQNFTPRASSGSLVDREKVLMARARRAQLSDQERQHLDNCLFITNKESPHERFEEVLSKGTDPNASNCLYNRGPEFDALLGPTPLIAAAIDSDNIECFKVLLKFGVDIARPVPLIRPHFDGPNRQWKEITDSPFSHLVYRNIYRNEYRNEGRHVSVKDNLALIKLTLEAGADINVKCGAQPTALHAVLQYYPGSDPNYTPHTGLTMMLLQHGADVETARTCPFYEYRRFGATVRSIKATVTPKQLWERSKPNRSPEVTTLLNLFKSNNSS